MLTSLPKIQDLTDKFISGTYSLITGPLKYRSSFTPIVEGVFRRDVLTLQTINFLSKRPVDEHLIYGNSCMDLFRRVFEDMVSLEYMILKGKETMAKKFLSFKAVEVMRDISYLKEAGESVEEIESSAVYDFDLVKNMFPDSKSSDGVRRSWAGVSVETMIGQLLDGGAIKEDERKILLQSYQAGCYKNHFSPTDISNFLSNKVFAYTNKADMHTSLMLTLVSIIKIADRLVDEVDDASECAKAIVEETWEIVLNAHITKVLEE